MPSRRVQALRKLRKEFDRFPNLDLAAQIELGRIGYFDSRKLVFDWRTQLSSISIKTKPIAIKEKPSYIDEIYTSDDAVDYEFTFDEKKLGKALFSFSKSYSLAIQAIDMTTEWYEIEELENDILNGIAAGKVKWDEDWIVVTQVFRAPSFSMLVASGKKSEVEISTSIPVQKTAFNIADPKLGLLVTRSKRMAYHIVARQNVTPFFRIHQFKGSWKETRLQLKPYGRG